MAAHARPLGQEATSRPVCLAIPGRIIGIEESETDGRVARVDYGIAVKAARLLLLPEAQVGDYVIVQAGYASTLLPEAEALEALACARQIDEALAAPSASGRASPVEP